MLGFVPVLHGCVWLLSKEEVFVIGTMLANFHMCGIMLVFFKSCFQHAFRNASPRGPMC